MNIEYLVSTIEKTQSDRIEKKLNEREPCEILDLLREETIYI